MAYDYDDQNIFAKILRGEIPNRTVMETEHTLAFEDITPQAPVHVLVIPKGAYATYDDFAGRASQAEIVDFTKTLGLLAQESGVAPGAGGDGFRMITNAGDAAGQEVAHMHVHLIGGRRLGRMLQRAD